MKSNAQVIQELNAECNELGIKLNKITAILSGEDSLKLRNQQVSYLFLQQKIIAAYMDVLDLRITDLEQAIKEVHDD